MLKLLALGTLGYIAYRYYHTQGSGAARTRRSRQAAVAGGPLSEFATVQHDPDQPPANDPYTVTS